MPFRFLAAWLTYQDFDNFVGANWDHNVSYIQAAKDITTNESPQNLNIFGNILQRKRSLLARIGGIQKALETQATNGLRRLELKLKRDLEEVLTQEELLWYQKSRKDWIIHGDRNTTFFYQKTITRRRRNRIEAITNDAGQWLYETEVIKQHAVKLFSTFYTEDSNDFQSYPLKGCFLLLDVDSLMRLNDLINDMEIRRAIFSMKPLKEPRMDGLHATFYQSQWSMGASLCRFVKEIFHHGSIPSEINRTLLVLIPKTDNPVSLTMYRSPYKSVYGSLQNSDQDYCQQALVYSS